MTREEFIEQATNVVREMVLNAYPKSYTNREFGALFDQLQKTIYNIDYTKLPSVEQLYNTNPMLTIDNIAEVLDAIKEGMKSENL